MKRVRDWAADIDRDGGSSAEALRAYPDGRRLFELEREIHASA
jgi:hypothetical protein